MSTTDNSIHVLLIEDNPGDGRLIREMLQEAKGRKIVLEHCATLTQGLQALSKNDFSILLLDLTLPDSIGFDTFVKVYTQNPQIPIIVLTGTNDEELARKSVRTGAQDYLLKGQIDSSLLSRSISYAIERAGLLRVVQQELIERKAMESMLRKINRALRVLSECNEIVVRATEENVLAEKICGAITTHGEYQFAWVAITEPDDSMSIQPIAIAGSKDCHSPEEASAWFRRDTDSPLSEALKTGKVVVCDDVTVDNRCSNLKTEADKLGYRSFVILPLVTEGKTLGVVQICSREPNRFDQEELKLLEELKEDIAYAIISIRTEKERKQTQEALRESEEIFDQFLTNSPVLVYIKDEQHRFKKFSKSFENLFGKSTSELLGKDLYDLLPPELAKIVLADDQTVLKGGIGVRAEEKLGDTFFSSIKFPIHRGSGKPDYLGGFSIDITERTRAEEALRESEERFRTLFEQAAVGVAVLETHTGQFVRINKKYSDFLGYTTEEMTHKTFQDVTYPDDISTNFDNNALLITGAISEYSIEKRYVRKDGKVLWGKLTASPLWKPGTEPKTYFHIAVVEDITERKRIEEALKLNEEKLKELFESAPVGYHEIDEHGNFNAVNQTELKMLGYSCEEMVGWPVWEFTSDIEESRKRVLGKLAGNLPPNKNSEQFFTRKDGTVFPALVDDVILRKEHREITGIRTTILDITERKQAEEKNRQLQQQLIQAQKLESLGTLASGIAHDFNNILGIILAYSSLLEKIKMGSEKYSESLNAITNAVQRGAALVRQILTFARKTDILFEPMNLMDLVHELLSMLQQTFPKTIIFKENFEKDIPYIFADRTQIYQALLNLYVNARDAMPKGGCITLTIEKRTGEQIRGQFPTANQDLYLCVSVTDNGMGLDEATRSRIFDPFFTTKEKGKGTGLGLSVVFGVVQTHHGFIDVESEPGKGTTFLLYLPALQTVEPIREEEGKTLLEEKLGGTETLLVIEDEKALSELVRLLLETKGYKVHTAQDGNEAIEVYKRYKEEIDIVLTDIGLPGMVGAEVFKKLKEINPNVSVIFCSGSNESEIISELYKAGAKGFIQKPYNPNEILRKLREVLDGK